MCFVCAAVRAARFIWWITTIEQQDVLHFQFKGSQTIMGLNDGFSLQKGCLDFPLLKVTMKDFLSLLIC